MRSPMKRAGIIFGGLVGVLLIGIIGITGYGQLTYKRVLDRPLYEISADMSTEGIARGEYLVRSIMACSDCHSQDPEKPNLAGMTEEVSMGPIKGLFAAPNLTNDRQTGLAQWTDAEIARAIREGVDKDGRELLIMPSVNYYELSDEDTAAIVGYLRSIETVNNPVPEMEINWAGKALLVLGMFPKSTRPPITSPIHAPSVSSPDYGRYLVVLSGCRDCHGVNLDGKEPLNPVPGMAPAPNITTSGGMASWSEAQFVEVMRTGVTPSGRKLSDGMPWKNYSGMTDVDLHMLFEYLSNGNVQSASQ